MKISIKLSMIGLLFFLSLSQTIWARSAPHFFMSNIEGKRFFSRQATTPYVVSFFDVRCKFCIKEIPSLYMFMLKKYPTYPLLFIDPVSKDTKQMIADFAKRLRVPKRYFYSDALGKVGRSYFKDMQMAFPTIFVVHDKKIVYQRQGYSPKMLQEIDEIFKSINSNVK